jgi:hypothetical protein
MCVECSYERWCVLRYLSIGSGIMVSSSAI